MFAIPEQFSNATKANFESQFALFSSLTNKAFEGVEKFVDLNITAAKASLEESSVATRQLLAAKDPQEFFTLTAAQAQPVAEKAIAYGRHLASIASGTGAEFEQEATLRRQEPFERDGFGAVFVGASALIPKRGLIIGAFVITDGRSVLFVHKIVGYFYCTRLSGPQTDS